ncbi:MAG TPA: hypothetical protein VJ346_07010 [Bacteroidales bacterium]|nr:hypothetical protein [Bacteroidales bacterium]
MKQADIKETRLPAEFQKYFWDCDFNELTFNKYPRFISERLLNYGDMDGVKWLLSLVSKDFLKEMVKTSRNLNNKTRNYWNIILS